MYNVKPNDLILFKPHTGHCGHSVSLPFHFLCIHFDLYVSDKPNDLQVIQNQLIETPPSKPVEFSKIALEYPDYTAVSDFSYMDLLLRRILNESAWQYTGFNTVIKVAFLDLLVNLFRQKEKTFGEKAYSPEIQAAVEYIKQYYQDRIFIEELAAHVHLQSTYLCSLFKKQTGRSIAEYIRQHRINTAKTMLLETERKIEDIAVNTGFYDMRHFSKTFKNAEGLTPALYRKMKR